MCKLFLLGATEMAQQRKALAAKPDGQDLIPGAYPVGEKNES